MAGRPDAAALVEAVRGFIAGLALNGREAFHAKVAANALAIVARELEQQPDVAEAAVLEGFLSSQGPFVTPAKAGVTTPAVWKMRPPPSPPSSAAVRSPLKLPA